MQDELERRIEPNATVLIAGRGDQGAIPVLLPIIAASPLETDKDSEGVPNSNRPSEIPSPRMNQVRNLCNECPEFRDALSVADEKLSAANTKIQDLCQQIKQLQRHNFSQQKHFEQSSSNYMSEKEAEILFLKEDNSNLRGMIDEMKSANAVVHEDAHYIKLLESLNGTILSSVAKAFKSSCQQDLSEEAGNKILDTLSRIDPWGKQTVEALSLSKVTIWAFHKDAKKRMVLVRHIIALFLWESVFDPFAFGLEKTVSHNLRTIEEDILSSEADFSKALMFRQALGQAEVRQLRGRTQESAKSKLVARIEETIKPLLPRPIDIQPMVSKIVGLAVDSANEMTEEQAMFLCLMIQAGRPHSESSVQIAGEGQSGNVFMCTFPMFARLIRDEGKEKLVSVVKACVELESAFNILNT